MSEPTASSRPNLDERRDSSGFTRFDDAVIEAVQGSITRFHVVNAICHTIVASGAVMPDGSVAATPRHDGEPLAGQTEQWDTLADYREQVVRRGWYVTFEDPPVPGEEKP